MQHRKLKLNILDIAIFVAVICAIATLVFRDTIHETFSDPEIVTLSVTVRVNNADESLKTEFENRNADFFLNVGSGIAISVPITKAEIRTDTNEASILFTCRGYKKLGRFYTENDERIGTGNECRLNAGDKTVSCVIESIKAA